MADNVGSGATGITASPNESLINYTHVIYGLHAFAAFLGLATSATVVGNFICGIPSIIAVVMNYSLRGETRGTFLESHFRWQIRTFWFAVLWAVIVGAVTFPLYLILIGYPLSIIGFGALAIWIIYRVVRGWLALRDRRPMYE
jgi:uncharacterized membrane protein